MDPSAVEQSCCLRCVVPPPLLAHIVPETMVVPLQVVSVQWCKFFGAGMGVRAGCGGVELPTALHTSTVQAHEAAVQQQLLGGSKVH